MRRLEASLTVALVTAALLVAAAVVKREFIDAKPQSSADRGLASDDWQKLLELGQPLGDTTGTAKVVVLADFECPACRRFHANLERVLAAAAEAIDARLVHMPLSYHPRALPSARAFECAVQGGAFARSLAAQFFEHQDSLGVIPWSEFAARAGSANPSSVENCMLSSDSTRFRRIAVGLALAERVGAPGTPAVVVNGILRAVPPSESELLALAGQR